MLIDSIKENKEIDDKKNQRIKKEEKQNVIFEIANQNNFSKTLKNSSKIFL